MTATDGANFPLQQLALAANRFWFAEIVDFLYKRKWEDPETSVRILRNCPRNGKPRNAGNHA